jgi:drug/metabolite transporter (DMT)-like permease
MLNATLYIVSVLIWGTTWLAVTFQLGVVPVEQSVAYRFLISGALLLIWCLARNRKLNLSLRNHLFVALQGLCLFCVNYVLFYASNAYLHSGLLAVIFSTLLLMNVVTGTIFLGARISARVVAGGVIGLAGMALLFRQELHHFDLQSGGARGLALSLLATVFVSVGNITSARNQRAGISVTVSNALGMAYGGLMTLLFALAKGEPLVVEWSFRYGASFLFLVIFGSIVAFGTYLTLLGRIGPDRAAYAMVLFPVIALILSTVYEGYQWTVHGLIGVALILAGNVVVLAWRRPKERAD